MDIYGCLEPQSRSFHRPGTQEIQTTKQKAETFGKTSPSVHQNYISWEFRHNKWHKAAKGSCNSKDHQPPKSPTQLHISPTRPAPNLSKRSNLCDRCSNFASATELWLFWAAEFQNVFGRQTSCWRKSGEKTSWGWYFIPFFTGFYTSKRWLGMGFFFHQQSHPKTLLGPAKFASAWLAKWVRKLCSVWCEAIHLKFGAKMLRLSSWVNMQGWNYQLP